jgi:hypothetical protein
MNDANQSIVRAVLKFGAGYLVSKGIIDDSLTETFIAAGVGLFALGLGN